MLKLELQLCYDVNFWTNILGKSLSPSYPPNYGLKSINIVFIQGSSSSSYRAASTDIPDPLSPLLPIIHRLWSTSLMSSSLLLQQCPACLVRLTWIVFMMGGRWPYSWCIVGCCRQDLFKDSFGIK